MEHRRSGAKNPPMKTWFRCLSIVVIKSLSSCSMVEELCGELIPLDYEIYKAPKNNAPGKALNVFIGFQVLEIGEINEEKMDYHFHLFIMYAWNDTRLKLEKYTGHGKPAILYSECKHYMWTPDVYFETAKEIETFSSTSPTTILNIFPDGSVVMSVRYSFKTDCSMEFYDYPFDTQKCEFLVALMYSHDGIAKLKWLDDAESPISDPPIQMMREIELLQFYLLEPTASQFTKVYRDGNFTNLVAKFKMVRRLTGSIISTYAPSVLIVIMSWVTFWLRMDAIPARVALSITSLLTVCTQSEHSKSQLPPVNYMTAMDIWLFMCIITVFSTLVVTAASYNVYSKKCNICSSIKKVDRGIIKNNTGSRNHKKKSTPWVLNNNKKPTFVYADSLGSGSGTNYLTDENCPQCLSNQKMGHRIDEISKVAFPGSFLIASVIYCIHYGIVYYNYD